MNLICIPALKCHKQNLVINIANLLNYVNKNDILIVTPDVDDFKDFKLKGFNVKADSFFYDISKSDLKKLLNFEKKVFKFLVLPTVFKILNCSKIQRI